MVVSLWSGPRNCSTALMYAFAQHPEFRVVDEPLFGHFLRHTGVQRPSREEVLATMPWKREEVLKGFAHSEGHVFLKHMANHLEGWPSEDFATHRHLILTRHPRKVLRSYRAHVEDPTMLDLCYQHQWAWWEECQKKGWPVAVVESDNLVAHPEASLRKVFDWLGLDFDCRMLKWEAGPRPEDGIWAKYWYQRVHESTGWNSIPANPSMELPEVEERFLPFVRELESLYERLCVLSLN